MKESTYIARGYRQSTANLTMFTCKLPAQILMITAFVFVLTIYNEGTYLSKSSIRPSIYF